MHYGLGDLYAGHPDDVKLRQEGTTAFMTLSFGYDVLWKPMPSSARFSKQSRSRGWNS